MNIQSLFIALIAFLPVTLHAEVVQIPLGKQSKELQSLERPTLGMSKDQVEAKFGEPKSWSKPKGEPPISKWDYEQFVVYFESEYVIHAVLKHAPKNKLETTN